MIANWAYEFLAACDSACIVFGISRLYFLATDERSTSLNDLGKTVNGAPPVTVVALDGVMVPVVVALKYIFYGDVLEIVWQEQK